MFWLFGLKDLAQYIGEEDAVDSLYYMYPGNQPFVACGRKIA